MTNTYTATTTSMTDSKALIERLRADWPEILVEKHWMMDSDAIEEQRREAADAIEKLKADNARLREALESIVNSCGQCGGYGTYPEEETVTGKVLWWDCSSPQCKAARAALQETSHD